MIFQVRQGVFETNSSSTHTLTICSKDDSFGQHRRYVKSNSPREEGERY